MDTELQEEKLTEPAQEAAVEESTAAEEAAGAEQQAEPEQDIQEPPKEKKEFLLPFLTILLIVLGIGEAAFWGYFGLSSYRNSLAMERYEAQQKALEEERAANGIVGGSAYGPNLKVENGAVTWRREEEQSTGSTLTQPGSTINRREDGLRLSWLSVPRIPYYLAQMDEDQETLPAASPAPSAVDDEEVPTST